MSILSQFEKLPATAVSDAMQGMNNLDPAIKPLKSECRVVGRAFTVKMPVGDNLVFLKALREAKPGDVLVVDAKGDVYRAFAGDFMIEMAKTLGVKGIVGDGAIRDIDAVKRLNLPVFCRGSTLAASGKEGMGEINVPISCGGVAVHPGDIIVGDADGVVVVPQTMEEEVLKKAFEKAEFDERRSQRVSGNREEILKYLDQAIDVK